MLLDELEILSADEILPESKQFWDKYFLKKTNSTNLWMHEEPSKEEQMALQKAKEDI